ncbi:MAG: 50S ribosomal protein L21 [Bacillota bacterium]
MYAIVETGGKQYRVSPGSIVRIEKVHGDRGNTLVFDKVLAISDGESLKVGRPYIQGAAVKGTIIRQGKARKVLVFKYRAKTNYRKRYGHRQHFTEVRIQSIDGNAESEASA